MPLEHVIDDLPELRRIAAERGADRLIMAPPHTGAHEAALNLIRGGQGHRPAGVDLPGILEAVTSSVTFDHQPGLTLLGVRRFGLSRSSQAIKRGFDVVGASMTLVLFRALDARGLAVHSPGEPGARPSSASSASGAMARSSRR